MLTRTVVTSDIRLRAVIDAVPDVGLHVNTCTCLRGLWSQIFKSCQIAFCFNMAVDEFTLKRSDGSTKLMLPMFLHGSLVKPRYCLNIDLPSSKETQTERSRSLTHFVCPPWLASFWHLYLHFPRPSNCIALSNDSVDIHPTVVITNHDEMLHLRYWTYEFLKMVCQGHTT